MKYPKFLNENNNTIGVCAMSSGVGHKLDSFDASIRVYSIQWVSHLLKLLVFVLTVEPSCDALMRVSELNALVNDSSIGAVWLAAGGDFQFETLPYIDFEWIEKNPKWYLGASDPDIIYYFL